MTEAELDRAVDDLRERVDALRARRTAREREGNLAEAALEELATSLERLSADFSLTREATR